MGEATYRVGRGVPGRRRVPGWADGVLFVCRLVLLMALVVAFLPPPLPPGAQRWTYVCGVR